GVVDAHQVLVHHAAGPDVEVPHLAVPHLPGGQSHVEPVGEQGGVGSGPHQTIHEGGAGLGDSVGAITGTDAPTVQDHQQGFGLHVYRRGNEATKIAPPPGRSRTTTAPPERSTSRRTMYGPSPVPLVLRVSSCPPR